jgi:hypothetical protein
MTNNVDLEKRIAELEALLVQQPHKPNMWDKIVYKLSEQGTQRGLILVIPMILIYLFNIDKETAIDIVTGVLALTSAHDIVTEG